MESCRSHDYTDLVIVHEHRGEPDGLVVCHLPYGALALLLLVAQYAACSLLRLASISIPHHILMVPSPTGPSAYFGIYNAVLRHDTGDKKEVGTVSEAYPHLIFEAFTSRLGRRCASILKHLFPAPKPDSKRVLTFANQDDFISFRWAQGPGESAR